MHDLQERKGFNYMTLYLSVGQGVTQDAEESFGVCKLV